MATTYQSWSVVFGEQPSAAKWNILGTNDAGFNNGTALPVGSCVQTATGLTTAVATGSTAIPADDTIPQSGEGNEYMSLAITPRSATNLLVIESNWVGNNATGANTLTTALFQDSGANAIAAAVAYTAAAGAMVNIRMVHSMVAGTTSSTTFKVRAGCASAVTVTFNGSAGARLYGAITKSSMVIREYTV